MATIEQLAGNTGESRIPYNVAPPLMQSPVTPQERRYENIASDILSLMSQTGAAMEATAKLGDISTKRLATDDLRSFDKEVNEIMHQANYDKDGKPIGTGIDYEGTKNKVIAAKEKYSKSFSTQRQQDIYDSLYTHPADKMVLETMGVLNTGQLKEDYAKVQTDVTDKLGDIVVLKNSKILLSVYEQAQKTLSGHAYAVAVNDSTTNMLKHFVSDFDDTEKYDISNYFNPATGQVDRKKVKQAFADAFPGVFTINKDGDIVATKEFSSHISSQTLSNINLSLEQVSASETEKINSGLKSGQRAEETYAKKAASGGFTATSIGEFSALRDSYNKQSEYMKSQEFNNLPQAKKDILKEQFKVQAEIYNAHSAWFEDFKASLASGDVSAVAEMVSQDIITGTGKVVLSKEKLKSFATDIVNTYVKALDDEAKKIYNTGKPMSKEDTLKLAQTAIAKGRIMIAGDAVNIESPYVKATQAKFSQGSFSSLQEALYYAHQLKEMVIQTPGLTDANNIYTQLGYANYMITEIDNIVVSGKLPKDKVGVTMTLARLNEGYKNDRVAIIAPNQAAIIDHLKKNPEQNMMNILGVATTLANQGIHIKSVDQALDDNILTLVGNQLIPSIYNKKNGEAMKGSVVEGAIKNLIIAAYKSKMGIVQARALANQPFKIMAIQNGDGGFDYEVTHPSGNYIVLLPDTIYSAGLEVQKQMELERVARSWHGAPPVDPNNLTPYYKKHK
jgi:hypothetical protein